MDNRELFAELMGKCFSQNELQKVIDFAENLGFFEAPASVHHHGNKTGGLFEHSLKVTECLLELTEKLNLKWERERSPFVVGMFHDLCKCDNYVEDFSMTETKEWFYNNNSILPGHGEKSIIMLQQLFPLTDEEIACIRWHMGAFDDKSNWNIYGRACEKYPNVLYTHTADMMAAHIYMI